MSRPLNLAEGRALEARATPGPWDCGGGPAGPESGGVGGPDGETIATVFAARNDRDYEPPHDAAFIVWLRNNARTLLDLAEARRNEHARAVEALRTLLRETQAILDHLDASKPGPARAPVRAPIRRS